MKDKAWENLNKDLDRASMSESRVFGGRNHPSDPSPIPITSLEETRRFLPGAQFVYVGDFLDQHFDRIYQKHGLDAREDEE